MRFAGWNCLHRRPHAICLSPMPRRRWHHFGLYATRRRVNVKRTVVRLVAVLLVVALAGGVWLGFHRYGLRTVPDGQPPLRTLDASVLDTFVTQFNTEKRKRRLLVLLSPT